MATSLSQVRDALLTLWSSNWTATPNNCVSFQNYVFDPSKITKGASWMEVRIIPGLNTNKTLNLDLFVGTVTLEISSHTAIGNSDSTALKLIDAALSIYKGAYIVSGTSSLTISSISGPFETVKDGWFRLTTRINFRVI